MFVNNPSRCSASHLVYDGDFGKRSISAGSFDTCSSLDLIDEDVAIRCGFTLCPSDKMAFRVAGRKRVVSRKVAQVTLPLDDAKPITRTIRTVKHVRVDDVILGM